jgi:hypothetical protein
MSEWRDVSPTETDTHARGVDRVKHIRSSSDRNRDVRRQQDKRCDSDNGVGVTGRYSNRQITQLAAQLFDVALSQI